MASITDYDVPSSASASATHPAEATVPITLSTSLSQYAIPSGPYMVPVSWRRTHLSTLVNKLVSSSSSELGAGAVPFDFIIDSSLLRTTLGEYLETHGLTSESTLAIEYVRSTLPPTRLAAFEHDDWVSSVDCSHPSAAVYLTASYDGSVRLFAKNQPDEAVYTFSTINKAASHAGRATGLSSAVWTQEAQGVVTGGQDGRVQMWTLVEAQQGGWSGVRKWVGEAHNAPVSAVDTAQGPAGATVLSGGWDGVVAVWDDVASSRSPAESESDNGNDEQAEEEEEQASAKRRKTATGKIKGSSSGGVNSNTGKLEATVTLWHAAPLVHSVTGAKNVVTPNSRVTSVLFERTFSSSSSVSGRDPNRAWSAGINGQLKGWDLSSGGSVHTSLSLPSSSAEVRPILSLTHLSATTLVAGSADRGVHVFDTRSERTNLGIAIANAHRGPVTSVSANPLGGGHLFASASVAEAAVKVWDVRSAKKALFSLGAAADVQTRAHQGLLALHWSIDGQEVVAGGKDKRITVYRGSNLGA